MVCLSCSRPLRRGHARDADRHSILNTRGARYIADITLNVPDISCEHCERAITNALTPVEGVRTVQVDIPAKQVRMDYDAARVSLDRIKAILQDEDYPVESVATAQAATQ